MTEKDAIAKKFRERFPGDCYPMAVEMSIEEILEKLLPILQELGWRPPFKD